MSTTKLYLRSAVASNSFGTVNWTGSQSTKSDAVSNRPPDKNTGLVMTSSVGSAFAGTNRWYGETSASAGYALFGAWLSPKLTTQSLPSGTTFQLAIGCRDATGNMLEYLSAYFYLWHSGSGKGSNISSDPLNDGVYFDVDANILWRSVNLTASSIIQVSTGSQIVCEVWGNHTNTGTGARTASIYYDGASDNYTSSESSSVSADNCAAWFEVSGTLLYEGEAGTTGGETGGAPYTGPEWHVAKTGSNSNSGSINDPWLTITYACANSNVLPGHIIWIHSGTYAEPSIKMLISGNEATGSTTISAWNSESVIVSGCFSNIDDGGDYKNHRYNYFFRNLETYSGSNGFKFVCSAGQGSFTSAAHWRFENINTHHHLSNGVYLGYQNNTFGHAYFRDSKIHHNGSSTEGEGDSGIVFEASGTYEFWNSDVYSNGFLDAFWNDKGINCYNQPGYYYCIVSGCRIYDNYETGMDFPGAYSTISHNIWYDNGIKDEETAEGQTGDNDLSLQPGGGSGGNNIIEGNLFRDCGLESMWVSSPGNIINKNTFYMSSGNVSQSFQAYRCCIEFNKQPSTGSPATGNVVKNNIFINTIPAGHPSGNMYLAIICHNDAGYDTYGQNTWSNNIYYTPNRPGDDHIIIKNYDEGGGTGTKEYTLPILQASYSNQDVGSFYSTMSFLDISSCSINANSTAANVGTLNITANYTMSSFSGSAPDIGWWEALIEGFRQTAIFRTIDARRAKDSLSSTVAGFYRTADLKRSSTSFVRNIVDLIAQKILPGVIQVVLDIYLLGSSSLSRTLFLNRLVNIVKESISSVTKKIDAIKTINIFGGERTGFYRIANLSRFFNIYIRNIVDLLFEHIIKGVTAIQVLISNYVISQITRKIDANRSQNINVRELSGFNRQLSVIRLLISQVQNIVNLVATQIIRIITTLQIEIINIFRTQLQRKIDGKRNIFVNLSNLFFVSKIINLNRTISILLYSIVSASKTLSLSKVFSIFIVNRTVISRIIDFTRLFSVKSVIRTFSSRMLSLFRGINTYLNLVINYSFLKYLNRGIVNILVEQLGLVRNIDVNRTFLIRGVVNIGVSIVEILLSKVRRIFKSAFHRSIKKTQENTSIDRTVQPISGITSRIRRVIKRKIN